MKLVNITIYPKNEKPIEGQWQEGDHVFFIAEKLNAFEVKLIDSDYGITSGNATRFNGEHVDFVFTIESIKGRKPSYGKE